MAIPFTAAISAMQLRMPIMIIEFIIKKRKTWSFAVKRDTTNKSERNVTVARGTSCSLKRLMMPPRSFSSGNFRRVTCVDGRCVLACGWLSAATGYSEIMLEGNDWSGRG